MKLGIHRLHVRGPAQLTGCGTTRTRFVTAGIISALIAMAAVSPAVAAPILYGNFSGTHVTYLAVTETPADPLQLFGPPILSGGVLDFSPVLFEAIAGNGSDTATGDLSFTLVAKPGSRIDRITIAEHGDTTLRGSVPVGTTDTWSQANANGLSMGTFAIREVDFAPISPIVIPFALFFSPSGGTFFLGTDGGGGPLFETPFTGSAELDVEAVLFAHNILPFALGATTIDVEWTNTLEAASEPDTFVRIGKNHVSITTTVIPVQAVPEPTTALLFGCGMVAVTLARRLRRRGDPLRPAPRQAK